MQVRQKRRAPAGSSSAREDGEVRGGVLRFGVVSRARDAAGTEPAGVFVDMEHFLAAADAFAASAFLLAPAGVGAIVDGPAFRATGTALPGELETLGVTGHGRVTARAVAADVSFLSEARGAGEVTMAHVDLLSLRAGSGGGQ
jgi:hypothetical protein